MAERITINKAYLRGLIWLLALAVIVLMPRFDAAPPAPVTALLAAR
ncbi:hypothetical protein [Devosia sp.]